MPAAILIIDDDHGFTDQLSLLLRGAGYDVMVANDGEAAVRVLDQDRGNIDLVICDLVLPQMSGFDVIGHLTRHRRYRILAASAVFRSPTLDYLSTHLGVDAFLQKPRSGEQLNADEWLRAVARALGDESERHGVTAE